MDGAISENALAVISAYYNSNLMVVVRIGAVGIVNPAIGMYGLNGCPVAIVASPSAAILGHIPPRPDLTNADPHAGDDNTSAMMAELAQLYETYIDFFPSEDSYIICAVFESDNESPVPDHVAIIQAVFSDMGLVPEVHHYEIPVNRADIGEGTVVVVSERREWAPTVYVEDTAL